MARSTTIGAWWRTGVWTAGAGWCSGMCSIWERSIPASLGGLAQDHRDFRSPAPTGREQVAFVSRRTRSGDRRRKDSPHPARSTGTVPSAPMGCLLAGGCALPEAGVGRLLERPSAGQPQGHPVGSRAPNPGQLSAHWSGQRMASAPGMVRQKRDGRTCLGPTTAWRSPKPHFTAAWIKLWNTRRRSSPICRSAGRICLPRALTCCFMTSPARILRAIRPLRRATSETLRLQSRQAL